MKKVLLVNVALITLLVSACGSKSSETEAPVAPQEVQARSGEVVVLPTLRAEPQDEAYTLYPTYTPYPTFTSLPSPLPTMTMTDTPTPVDTATAEPTSTATIGPTATETPQEPTAESVASADVQAPISPAAQTILASQVSAGQPVELERIPDSDPGPPFTILVSAVRVQDDGSYKLTGRVRNDGAETYGGIGVIATFYVEQKPCYERTVRPRPGQDDSGGTVEVCDPTWHGPVRVYAACMYLEPGAECPFSLGIYGRDYVAYHLHPEGAPVLYRRPAALALSNLSVYNDGFGYVRVKGAATNGNAFAVRDAQVAGTLLDAAGQIVSVGTVLLPGEVAPGASVSFDLRIEQAPYSYYELSAQATQG